MKDLLYNAMRTPDGTLLVSKHQHDFVCHKDKNGEIYFVDGGLAYLRRSVNEEPYEDLCVYSTDPHEEIREVFNWGSYTNKKYPYSGSVKSKTFAYILGFLFFDGGFTSKHNYQIEIKDTPANKEILQYIINNFHKEGIIKSRKRCSNKNNQTGREIKRNTTIYLCLPANITKKLLQYFSGTKKERKIPHIHHLCMPYFLRGAFDAESCITPNIRKREKNNKSYICKEISLTFYSDVNLIKQISILLDDLSVDYNIRNKNTTCPHIYISGGSKKVFNFLDWIFNTTLDVVPLKSEKYLKYRDACEKYGRVPSKNVQFTPKLRLERVLLKDITTDHVYNILNNCRHIPDKISKIFKDELEYREKLNIMVF